MTAQPMALYASHLTVRAAPMTRQAYNDFRCWEVPAGENPADEGYMINPTSNPDYVTWAPKEVFDTAYSPEPEPPVCTRPPHQQRVIDERAQLATRLSMLTSFVHDANGLFPALHVLERQRMVRQSRLMADLLAVLDERIAAFDNQDAPQSASFDFGAALDAMKAGCAVARKGWNGSGMFAYFVPSNSYPAQTGVAKSHFGEGAMVPYGAYLAIKTTSGAVNTWAPSVGDVLAGDWFIVDAQRKAAVEYEVF